jgi:hypothetical protein
MRRGDDPLSRELDLLALEVRAHAAGVGGAGAREEEPGHGEAALVVVLELLGELDDDGVEDVAELAGLHEMPGEGAQADADLVRGEARAGVVVDGLQQVAHEAAGAVGDRSDRVAGGAQHGVADDADGSDGHACSSSPVAAGSWVVSQPFADRRRGVGWVGGPSGLTGLSGLDGLGRLGRLGAEDPVGDLRSRGRWCAPRCSLRRPRGRRPSRGSRSPPRSRPSSGSWTSSAIVR